MKDRTIIAIALLVPLFFGLIGTAMLFGAPPKPKKNPPVVTLYDDAVIHYKHGLYSWDVKKEPDGRISITLKQVNVGRGENPPVVTLYEDANIGYKGNLYSWKWEKPGIMLTLTWLAVAPPKKA